MTATTTSSSEHLFRCLNPKCRRRNRQQVFTTFNAMQRCKCGKVLHYEGEQQTLPFPKEESK